MRNPIARTTIASPIAALSIALVLGSLHGCSDQPTTPGSQPTVRAERGLGRTTADVPAGARAAPHYDDDRVAAAAARPIIRVYQNERPWGANRAHATLLRLGKVRGSDYFIHPLSALSSGIPAGTAVVLITSNSHGDPTQARQQNAPAAQAALRAFLQRRGVLIVDMGDNLDDGGFRAPGAVGTPARIFPEPCAAANFTRLGLNHPIAIGPDGRRGTADDLNNRSIDMAESCYVAHGNLEDGMSIPAIATRLVGAVFNGLPRAILAEYCILGGRVILDTITKEYGGHRPVGTGPSRFMLNLFHYALSPRARCGA
jgi:hypothetical protein